MRSDTRANIEAENAVQVILAILFVITMFAFCAAIEYWPVKKANGKIEQVHGDHVPWHRKDRNRQFVWDETREGPFRGASAFNGP